MSGDEEVGKRNMQSHYLLKILSLAVLGVIIVSGDVTKS
jgi:hypothetical protein